MTDRPWTPTKGLSLGSTAGHPWRGRFLTLMPFRVEEILLVCSPYDSFAMEEDGLLSEMIFAQYADLGLSNAPSITRVSTAAEALKAVSGGDFHLVIAMPRVGTMRLGEFQKRMTQRAPHIPVVPLVSSEAELLHVMASEPDLDTSEIFMWHGDPSVLVAIVKCIEDRSNIEHDFRTATVGNIIVVEDSPRFRSIILPLVYSEVVRQTRAVLADALNHMQRRVRMTARPKVLVAETYEKAMEYYSKYRRSLFGVISDVAFPCGGERDTQAGFTLLRAMRKLDPDLPICIQSSELSNRELAESLGASFLYKRSRTLLKDLSLFVNDKFGFGDFIFRLPDRSEVGRAGGLREMIRVLPKVPEASLAFHAGKNHFSSWFRARTEFKAAMRLRPRQVEDFESVGALRQYLVNTCRDMLRSEQSGVIEDFSATRFDADTRFARIGTGAVGAKARGLAFVAAYLEHVGVQEEFRDLQLFVPQTVVVGTDVFDDFVAGNGLSDLVRCPAPDHEIQARFVAGTLPPWVTEDLQAYLQNVDDPLAVRSSSVLEDSEFFPFAGVYSTFMIANSASDPSTRLEQLSNAIKLVFASSYLSSARDYIEVTPYHLEAQKMAVVLQPVVGKRRGKHYYPTLAGTARSRNYYPVGPMRPEDGAAAVALGLGEEVVSGGAALKFSPAHPRVLHQMDDPDLFLDISQKTVRAVDMASTHRPGEPEFSGTVALSLEQAEIDGTLHVAGSVWSPDNQAFYDGLSRPGIRVVSFAHILKNNVFPLAALLSRVLQVGEEGMNTPVEIEYAANLDTAPPEFAVLQMRPFSKASDDLDVEIGSFAQSQVLCTSASALGNGVTRNILDIIYVRPDTFDRVRTPDIAREVARANERLKEEGRTSLLIGLGRWGTSNPSLGIPVTWPQISTARVLIESTMEGFKVEPSQGSHFFHNLTSLGIKYLSVEPQSTDNYIDWSWLEGLPSALEGDFVRHVRLPTPVEVRVDGRHRRGVVLKPTTH